MNNEFTRVPCRTPVSCRHTAFFLSAASLLAAFCIAGSLQGATIMIDDFVTGQAVTATASVPSASSSVAAPEAIGGERDMRVVLLAGYTNLSLSANPFGGELLIHDSGAAVKGSSLTVWDGLDGDPDTIDYTGLGGVDLLQSGSLNAFELGFLAADLAGDMKMTVFDASDATGNTWSQAVFSLPGAVFVPADVQLPYASFTTFGSNGAADFANVGAVSLEISNVTTGSLDVQLGSVSAVPEPATGVLALLGLAIGLACTRRVRCR